MENNDSNVEIVSEPKISDRYGLNSDRKTQKKSYLLIGLSFLLVSLIGILFLQKPNRNAKTRVGVKVPEASEVSQNSQMTNLSAYSSSKENEKIKDANKRQIRSAVVRLPGLQKLDRKKSGEIPPGSLLKAKLTTGASNGPVKAEVLESLQIQGETLIPAGATLLGVGQSGDDRLLIRFNQIIFKDGSFENIQAQAADNEDKIAGLRGSRVGSYALKYGAAIGLNFVGGMAEGLQNREIVGQQVVTKPDARNALLNGTSKATLELANDTMSNLKSKPPVIEVPSGKIIYVIFEK